MCASSHGCRPGRRSAAWSVGGASSPNGNSSCIEGSCKVRGGNGEVWMQTARTAYLELECPEAQWALPAALCPLHDALEVIAVPVFEEWTCMIPIGAHAVHWLLILLQCLQRTRMLWARQDLRWCRPLDKCCTCLHPPQR